MDLTKTFFLTPMDITDIELLPAHGIADLELDVGRLDLNLIISMSVTKV